MFRVCMFNANSLAGKAEPILQFAEEQAIDLFIVLETWLTPDRSPLINQNFINITKPIKHIRSGRTGTGGILGFCNPAVRSLIRVVEIDADKDYVVLRVGSTLLAAAYFSPATDNRKITAFLDKMAEISQQWQEDIVMMGDYNARHTAFGDTMNSTRGTLMLDLITQHGLTVLAPTQGRFTSFHGMGCGIPDMVLSNTDMAKDLIIHEDEDLGGSDHRPLSFTIVTPEPSNRQFERWNVRKLACKDGREKYNKLMEDIVAAEGATFMAVLDEQDGVDKAWSLLGTWIDKAAEIACGKVRMEPFAKKSFWTDELIGMREEASALTKAHQQAIQMKQAPVLINALASRRAEHNRLFRETIMQRRLQAFDEVINNLAEPQNRSAFLRMVKSTQSRRSRSGCSLDPEKINEHANYYRTTFGGPPRAKEGEWAQEDLEAPIQPMQWTIEPGTVAVALRLLPMGKAPGPDGIMAEFLRYASKPLEKYITALLNKCLTDCTSPKVWKQALIVPVYKQKGSNTEIANYRPIALTCIGRRLYERILHGNMQQYLAALSDFQGGFRPSRSTVDQAFCLHEIIQANPGLECTFLDLKAAYDMVDRRVLWTRLQSNYGMPTAFIQRIRDLFDYNESLLVVDGRRSDPIANTRGLLQGSSLSPTLFNCFINELCDALQDPVLPKVTTAGYKTNSLFFADDANLHTKNKQDMHTLLRVCEDWSTRVGMQFAPQKCIAIADSPRDYKMYNQELTVAPSSPYLGFPFVKEGIDFEGAATKRIQKATKVLRALVNVGYNGTGWPAIASAQVYKSFIRPAMEYGTQLYVLPDKLLDKYQKAQNAALRAVFSAPRNTSTNALHKLLQIAPYSVRNQEVQIRFASKLHNSRDAAVPAVQLWWRLLQTTPKNSLVTNALTNPLWPSAKKISHLNNTLQRDPEPTKQLVPFPDEQRKQIQRTNISKLDKDQTNVAGAVTMNENEPHRHMVRPYAFTLRAHRVAVQRWVIGNVAWHQPCRKCDNGTKLSRAHAIECSGALHFLEGKYAEALSEPTEHNAMDHLLNKYRLKPPTLLFYVHIFKAISMIYKKCLGLCIKPNGYWAEQEADNAASVASNSTTDSRLLLRIRAEQANLRRNRTGPRQRAGRRAGRRSRRTGIG